MRESIPDNKATPPGRRKNGIWRVCKWPVLVGGGGLFFFGIFLIAISLPNLCGELPPPEISGPDRVSRNASVPPPLETSGTPTESSSPLTSGTHSFLNLDDFPHLSPTMRNLTRDWFDLCAETDQALAAITDPALRAQAAALLKNRGKATNEFLNRPLEWGKGGDWMTEEFQNYRKRDAIYGEYCIFRMLRWINCVPTDFTQLRIAWRNYPGFDPQKVDELAQLLEKCPAFSATISKEATRLRDISGRMDFEFYVYHRKWDWAAEESYIRYREPIHFLRDDPPPLEEPLQVTSLEEQMYCMRQMGIRGKVGVVARTYRQALRSHWKKQNPERRFDRIEFYNVGDLIGAIVVDLSIGDPSEIKNSGEPQFIYEEREKASRQNTAAPVVEKATEEKNPDPGTSRTLETREATRRTSSTQETSSTSGIGI